MTNSSIECIVIYNVRLISIKKFALKSSNTYQNNMTEIISMAKHLRISIKEELINRINKSKITKEIISPPLHYRSLVGDETLHPAVYVKKKINTNHYQNLPC